MAAVPYTSMTERRLKRPRDPAQLAKLIVDIATGEVEDREPYVFFLQCMEAIGVHAIHLNGDLKT